MMTKEEQQEWRNLIVEYGNKNFEKGLFYDNNDKRSLSLSKELKELWALIERKLQS